MIDPLDPYTLGGMAAEALDTPNPFIRNTIANGGDILFDTQEIMFDKVLSSRRMAPFVAPTIAGKPRALRGSRRSSYIPPYVKPLGAVDPDKTPFRLRPGERMGGELSPDQRLDRARVQEIEDQDAEIIRAEEYLSLQVALTGKVVVQSPEHPAVEIDYGRPAAQTETLTGADRWGEAGVSPHDTLVARAEETASTSGAQLHRVILDPKAAGLLQDDEKLQKKLDNRRQPGGEIQLIHQAVGGQGHEARYIGTDGQFEFWSYQAYYEVNGVLTKFMPDYTAIMVSDLMKCHMCYGAIKDIEAIGANALMTDRFYKEWINKNPSGLMLMTQSAPLPVPERVEASFCLTVR